MAGEETDLREAEIGRIVNDYLDRKGRGEAISEAELLEAHPQLAADLASHFELVHNMVPGLGGQVQDSQASPGLPSDSLPGYQILSEIHRGGQGVVYQALQKGTRRKVAVKVMREGPFAGWRDRARFDREIQILGSLRHPHIVSIYDSGVVDGSHFFVMDYVSGQPLDLWASSGPRTVEQVLELFVKICDAINTAHLRGIVHRDLKPGNIRIGPDGEPHVLDFGLAKVSSECEPDGPTMTTTGQFVGSLPWSSPEQAQGLSDQIDTRTDVYALGVVLYQLLTGRFPYEVVGAMRDVLNRIVNAEPARPSGIRSTIDGEVETILLKCLAKEPARRYQTAGELGRDLERYLRGEPITAKSDSTLYVLGKALRRHRAAVGAAMSFVLLLTVALIASTVLWRVAEQRADELNHTAYVHRIALAQNACEKDLLSRALQVLNECSPEFRGWEWYYLRRRATRSPLLTFRAHDKPIKCLAVSPDGKCVATGSMDRCLSVWEPLTGRPVGRPLPRSRDVAAIAFSPDSTRLVAASEDQSVVCLATASAEVLWSKGRADLHDTDTTDRRVPIVFTADGKEVIVGGRSGKVFFFEAATGTELRTFESLAMAGEPAQPSSAKHGVQCLAISPDGRRLACGECRSSRLGESSVAVLDVSTGESLGDYRLFPNSVLSLTLSPDGKRLACGGQPPANRGDTEDTLKVIDPETGRILYSTRGHGGEVAALAFSPDGQILASAGVPRVAYKDSPDNTLKLWDSRTGELKAAFSAHAEGAMGVGWLPDGRTFVSAGGDGLVKAWSRQVAEDHLVLRGHRSLVQHVAFSPDGRRLASLCVQNSVDSTEGNEPDNSLRIWDASDGSLQLLIEPGRQLRGLAWSPDGDQIASMTREEINVWSSRTATERRVLRSKLGAGLDLAYSRDGRYLAGAFKDGSVVWTTENFEPVFETGSGDVPYRTEFSPDGRLLAVGLLHGAIQLIELKNGREHGTIRTEAKLSVIRFTPDSRRLICGHFNGSISAWDVRSLTRVGLVCPSAGRRIQSIAVSPDGSRFASVGADMLLRVWDTAMLREVLAMQAHDGQAMGVHFSPDGKQIATCGLDSLVKIWQSGLDEPLEAASQPALADGAGME